jgi:hypothetical protein
MGTHAWPPAQIRKAQFFVQGETSIANFSQLLNLSCAAHERSIAMPALVLSESAFERFSGDVLLRILQNLREFASS